MDEATTTPVKFENYFDLAFSMYVIYLISDLKEHAWKIKKALKPGGVYYANYLIPTETKSLVQYLEDDECG